MDRVDPFARRIGELRVTEYRHLQRLEECLSVESSLRSAGVGLRGGQLAKLLRFINVVSPEECHES